MEAKAWEDTVMSDEQILSKYTKTIEDGLGLAHTPRILVEAQAEISFKAGRDSRKDQIEGLMSIAFKDGEKAGIEEAQNRLYSPEVMGIAQEALDKEHQAGIREVVEEYNTIRACTHMVGYHYLRDCKECLEAQLKKWGIK